MSDATPVSPGTVAARPAVGLAPRALIAWVLIVINTAALIVILVVERNDLAGLLFGPLFMLASFIAVGGVLAVKRPANLEAWLLLATATGWSLAFVTPFDGGWVLPLGLMSTQLLLRFPDGSLPSPRWRWFSTATNVLIVVLTFTVTTADTVLEDSQGPNQYYVSWAHFLAPLILLLPVFMVVSAASLVARYRRADIVERQQIRWLAWAAGTVTGIYVVTLLLSINVPWDADASTAIGLLQALSLVSFSLIPITIGIAVLKYRLYDIDRVISRTTSYTIVTGVVLVAYGVIVGLGSRLLPDSSDLAVAVATLAAAAVLRPLLSRVQSVVDKRFNRERYNAAQTLNAFGEHLRELVDTEAVADKLVVTVGTALEPSRATLWLRDAQADG